MASLLHPQNPKQEEDPDSLIKNSSFLSRGEVLRRRSRHAKALYKHYRSEYWALVEEVRAKHREYYFDYAVSPLENDNKREEGDNDDGLVEGAKRDDDKVRARSKCGFVACKSKAMPFTRFCHLHILADPKQTLYKGCIFISKSNGQNWSCGKPILRAVVPSLCAAHFQKAQKNLSSSLKKVGINLCSSRSPTAEFDAILDEYIHNIQLKRKKASTKSSKVLNSTGDNMIHERKNI